MAEWILATRNTELNGFIKDISGQRRNKIEVTAVKDPEELLRVLKHHQPDVLLLTEAFINYEKDEEIKTYLSKIRFLSNVRIIFFAPGRTGGDPVLEHIIRECGVYDLFLEAEIDGKRLQSVLFNPSEKCSVSHLIFSDCKDELFESKDEVESLGAERQKKILRNILNGISKKDFNEIFEDIPSDIKSRLVRQEVIEREIVREVPKIIVKNNLKIVERLQIQKQQILAFWSPKGHQGRSHILTQLSILLSQQNNARVLVLDLNFADPSLDMYFGFKIHIENNNIKDDLSPLQHILDSAGKNELNINVLQEQVIKARQGLDVIIDNPYSAKRKDSAISCITSLIDTASELYDYILLDLPCSLDNDEVRAALKRSTSIIIVSEGELTAVRSLHTKLLRNVELFPADKCKIIINKAVPGVLEVEEIKGFLKQEIDISYIPYSQKCLISLLQQKPFIYGCSGKEMKPYKKFIEKVVTSRKG